MLELDSHILRGVGGYGNQKKILRLRSEILLNKN